MRNRFSHLPRRGLPAITLCLWAGLGVTSYGQQPGLAPAVDRKVDFATEVHPILVSKCLSCHSGVQAQGGLSVERVDGMLRGGQHGPAIVPGASAESLLMRRVAGLEEPLMPMSGEPLGAEEIGVLRAWIDQGAEWDPDAIATASTVPLAPRRPDVPKSNTLRSSHPIDRFVGAYLERHDVAAPQPVSDALFARRAYLDLWGIVPSPGRLDEFVSKNDAEKRALLVDRLLADQRHYSEHWISFWNDLLRNDEGVIYYGERKSITPWLLQALRENRPYDEMVQELLNPADEDDPEGYLTGVTWRGVVNASQTPPMQAAQNSAQVFLGINLKCASCHDSFINQWKLKDSYGLASLFSEEPLELVRCDTSLGVMSKPKFLFRELGDVDPKASMAERRAAAARLFTLPENGRFARTLVNRYWQRLFGRGLVETLDDMDQPAWDADLLDWLAADFAAHGYDLKHLLRRIMTSKTYQLPAVSMQQQDEPSAANKPFVFQGPFFRRLSAEQFADSISAITGEWRVKQPRKKAESAEYVREWQMKSSPLTRALGRAVRDQVITERNELPTTLQALELVNGSTFARALERGAQRLLGRLDPAPAPLFHSGVVGLPKPKPEKGDDDGSIEVDISGAEQLWLVTADYDSYDPEQVIPVWADAQLVGPNGVTPLVDLAARPGAEIRPVVFDKVEYDRAVAGALPSRHVFDIRGKGFQKLRARIGYDDRSRDLVIMPAARFFVFGQRPNFQQLIPVAGDPPFATESVHDLEPAQLIKRLYRHALGRIPAAAEIKEAKQLLVAADSGSDVSTEGLEDLLWSLFLSPEFQLIR